MNPTPIVQFQAVVKRYDGKTILPGLDLAVNEGEFLTLLGPSGCGKTTALRLLAGFETPDAGEVRLDGGCVNALPPHRRPVNTVFQSYALFPHMTVFDNVAFGLRMAKTPRADIPPRVAEALAGVQLEDLAGRKPHQLSGGQQQRVALARALVNRPRVLLLDESLSALDYRLRKEMQRELKALQTRLGLTFLFVTHDQEEALSMSDRVAVMRAGRIEQIGTPREIYQHPVSLFVAGFVGESNRLDAVVTALPGPGRIAARVEGLDCVFGSGRTWAVGDKVHVLLRPEHLRLEPEAAAPGRLRGTITAQTYKGMGLDTVVELDGGKRVLASGFLGGEDQTGGYKAGQRVAVAWMAGAETVLPAEA
ncbi:spermidine/putrescine ABC transporter ATP-binding protein PotA [Methylomagnum ishizawai]|uniref:spermidine/putrescine ABC transporter ATP-binding protein PotA n=1 Tax=Methylomagnum ishizawai TaxID=1760988 RepID=UPI001C32162A|nr:spermidine/putrescine ABC transporter ATP-binding protein PotA [Methylomagnum ishizawai]BBL73299.1 spermidine/putrescine import ATP-binding protein PotA [Methylomagnum ishizawai]